MKNIVIINSITLSPYALQPLYNKHTAFNLTQQFGESLPDVKKQVILLSSDQAAGGLPAKQIVDSSKGNNGYTCLFKKKWNNGTER